MLVTVMTTAPRAVPTIKKSLESVSRAALPAPTIFAEPGCELIGNMALFHEKQGVWQNWKNAASFGAYSEGATYVLTMQDDIDIHPGIIDLIEKLIPFHPSVGAVSLYASSLYGVIPGIHKVRTSGFWGSLCMLFEVSVLRDIINNPLAGTWKGINPTPIPSEVIDDDQAIAKILRRLNKSLYVVVPSPVKHTGSVSSIKKPHATRKLYPEHYSNFNVPILDQIPLADFQEITTNEQTPSWLVGTSATLKGESNGTLQAS